MNKLFFSLLVLISLQSKSMDNPKRFLIAGTSAIAVGTVGHLINNNGTTLAFYERESHQEFLKNLEICSKESMKGAEALNSIKLKDIAVKNFYIRSAIVGTLSFGAYLSAGLLAQFAYSSKLPTNNQQTYACALAILAGGSFWECARAKSIIHKKKTQTVDIISMPGSQVEPEVQAKFVTDSHKVARAKIIALRLGAASLTGLGIYGLYKNS